MNTNATSNRTVTTRKILTPAEARKYHQLSPLHSTLAILIDWGLILGSFLLFINFPNPLSFLISFIVISRTQVAFGILVHEAAHGRLFQTKRWNNFFGHVFCGAPIFLSLNAYRRTHLKHHQVPLTAEDPDITLTGGYPVSKQSFIRKLKRDLFGLSYIKFAKHFFKAAFSTQHSPKNGMNGMNGMNGTNEMNEMKKTNMFDCRSLETMKLSQEMIWMLVAQIVLLSLLSLMTTSVLNLVLTYFSLWLLPMPTLVQVILRIRGIAEHAGYEEKLKLEDQALISRTVVNPWEAFFLAPHNVNYHIEHHLYPTLPFHQLPNVHQILKERNVLPSTNVYTSYRQVVAEVVR